MFVVLKECVGIERADAPIRVEIVNLERHLHQLFLLKVHQLFKLLAEGIQFVVVSPIEELSDDLGDVTFVPA